MFVRKERFRRILRVSRSESHLRFKSRFEPLDHQSKMKSRRKIDEVEYFESPRDSDYFEKPLRRRRRKDRQVEIETDDDEDYDDDIEWSFEDAGTLYARQHRRRTRKSRIPENVRMTCVRKDSF